LPRKDVGAGEPNTGVQAVQIMLEIMEYIAKQKVAGVTEIANALGSTKARVHRHLRTLVNTGYAVQQATGDRYGAGPRLLVLAQMLGSENSLTGVARPVMQRLRDALGHTVALARVGPHSATMIDSCEGNGLINIAVRTGLDMPLHANAGGKLVLAYSTEDWEEQLLAEPLQAYTQHTIASAEELRTEIARVRTQGWANAPEEFVIGINAVAAPIFDRTNRLVATIALVNSVQFLGRRPTVEQIGAITSAAAEITRHVALSQ